MSANERRPTGAASETLAGSVSKGTAPHEPSAWLRAKIAARVAYVRSLGLDPDRTDPLIIAPLGRPGVPGEPSDRECDRCQNVTPEGPLFYSMALPVRPGLTLVGGLCAGCGEREGLVTR